MSSRWVPCAFGLMMGVSAAFLVPGSARADANRGSASTVPDTLAAQVDEILARWNDPDAPGMAVAVLQHGEVVYRRGFGSADLEHGLPITPTTVFQAASLAKQFTGMAIAMLAARGELSLDDDIQRYLPEVEGLAAPITIRQLLYHTSGLRDQWELLLLAGWNYEDMITQEDVLSLVRRQTTLNFPPGSRYLYTNTGYTLLATIVERVTGQSFREWMREEVFAPLGMDDTQILDDPHRLVENRAAGYYHADGGGYRQAIVTSGTYGATDLFTTVDDLLKWIRGLEEETLVDRAVIEEAQTVGRLNDGTPIGYAFGVEPGEHRGLRTVEHSGGQGGFRAFLLHIPEAELAVALLGNVAPLSVDDIAMEVADVYLEGLLEPRTDHGGAGHTTPRRAEAPTYTPQSADLEGVEGFYWCAELGAVYELSVDGVEVVLRDHRKGDMPLLPVSTDRFQEDMSDEFGINRPWMRLFEFEREPSGEVSGFRLSVGSAQNLRFTRLASSMPGESMGR